MRKLKRIITLLLCCLLLGMLSSTALAVITSAGIQIESWQDAENQDGIRPDQVDMILLRDGKEYTRVPLSDDSNWKFHLYNLPEMDDEGHAYTYTFEDPKLPGYTMTMQKITNAENGINNFFTAVFTHKPVMYDIAVTKVWDDLNNADGIRPESVTIRLMLNGKPQDQSLTLSAWNAWTDSFTILADTEGYHIEEDKVKGYSASISGDVRNGFIVTNKHVPAVRNTSDLPQTGDHSRMALWMTLCAASLGALAMLCMKKRRTE